MEAHFLSDVVAGEKRGFTPEPWYNSYGDCIIYQMADEAIIADRIDAVLTIYRSALTKKPIGYQIKGVGALMKKYGWGGVFVESQEDNDGLKLVSMSALLLAAYEEGPKTTGRRRGYADALETYQPGPRLRVDDLEAALN